MRLAERSQCEAAHPLSERIPHNGLGWTGTRCPKCGFMFFGEWEDWAKPNDDRTAGPLNSTLS
jgi:hypothetical protein